MLRSHKNIIININQKIFLIIYVHGKTMMKWWGHMKKIVVRIFIFKKFECKHERKMMTLLWILTWCLQ